MSNDPTADAVPDGPTSLPPLLAALDAADEAPCAAQLRARSYELLGIAAGTRLLDIGCGAGRAVAEAIRIGADARGVDIDEGMIALARRRVPEARFDGGDARRLPYPDASMDACRADKVLHNLANPAAAVAEARRVLVPGGRIALIGQDWDTIVIDAAGAEPTRTLVHARADRVAAPRSARGFRALLLDGGFHDVEVEVRTAVFTDDAVPPMLTGLAEAGHAAGRISRSDADAWLGDQRERALAGRAFVAVPMFLATGTRP
ncbi:methyltransferase domain-containing protein [Streptomyces sp. NPDC058653]|uniref:methyltransferase domain-containing protein n=1 Tax=Streptomyces sp. NPDC058653 TaxID=3346576 RepID=UPI0036595507